MTLRARTEAIDLLVPGLPAAPALLADRKLLGIEQGHYDRTSCVFVSTVTVIGWNERDGTATNVCA